jgi:hypothetical protein
MLTTAVKRGKREEQEKGRFRIVTFVTFPAVTQV